MEEQMVMMPRRNLGSQGFEVLGIGLGCMGMSPLHGSPKPEKELIQVIQTAIQLGITLLDTSDLYGPHTNITITGKLEQVLKGDMRQKVQLATKFGIKSLSGDKGMVVSIENNGCGCHSSCAKGLKLLLASIWYIA